MKPWMAIAVAVMLTFLVVGLAESEGKAFGQLGGYSRYSPSGDYTGGHQFDRNLIGGSQNNNSGHSQYSNARFVSYSRARSRYYRARHRSYYVGYGRYRRVGCR